ncbi:hypothetical protein HU200_054547 [Digitaria exilis]|uniref:Uncharacterized protein n=1 Tax=Digitaria exilis TaxID=1010633 RepID=A0A835E2L5_9POAL|nr:hypothetical protein HU200_054547 [Digitaria exilis]
MQLPRLLLRIRPQSDLRYGLCPFAAVVIHSMASTCWAPRLGGCWVHHCIVQGQRSRICRRHPVHHRLVPLPPPPARRQRPEGEIGWIWSLHGGSDEGGGGNRIRFPDGGMRTGMMSPPWNKILRALPPFVKQDGEKHEKEDDAQFCLQKCWPPFIGRWHYFWPLAVQSSV